MVLRAERAPAHARRVGARHRAACSPATWPRSGCAPASDERLDGARRARDRAGRQPALAAPPPVPGARRPDDAARGVRRASRAAGSPTSATATTSRARWRSLGALAGVEVAIAAPDGYQLEDGARRAADRRPRRGGRGRRRRLHRRLGLDERRRGRGRRAPRGARALPARRRAARPRGARTRSRCTACPPIPARRSPRRCSTATRQRIWDQAENRRHAQKALLEYLASRRVGWTPDAQPGAESSEAVARPRLARRRARRARPSSTPRRQPPPPDDARASSSRGFLDPREVVVVTRERLQEALDEAVERGRMTRDDATTLLATCCARARADRRPARRHRGPARRRASAPPARASGLRRARAARGRPRAPRRRRRPVVPDPRLRRPDRRRRSTSASATSTPPSCARCATTSSATRTASRCSRRSSRSCSSRARRAPVILGGVSSRPPHSPAPRRGDELELTVDSLAYGGNGVARLDGYVVFVAGGMPGDRVRAVVGKCQARLRRGARGRDPRAVAGPHRRRSPTTPARRGRCCPTSASSRSRPSRSRDALTRIGRLEGFELEPIVPAVRAVALPQQARVLVRDRRRRRARLRLPRARPLRPDRADDRLQARLRARQRAARAGARLVPPPGPRRLGPARASSGFLRNLVVREGRRTGAVPGPPRHLARRARRRRADRRGAVRRAVLDADRRARREHPGRRDRAARPARRSCTSGSATCAS